MYVCIAISYSTTLALLTLFWRYSEIRTQFFFCVDNPRCLVVPAEGRHPLQTSLESSCLIQSWEVCRAQVWFIQGKFQRHTRSTTTFYGRALCPKTPLFCRLYHNVLGCVEEELIDLLRQFLRVHSVTARRGRLSIPRARRPDRQLWRGSVDGATHVHIVPVTCTALLSLQVHVAALLPLPLVGGGGGVGKRETFSVKVTGAVSVAVARAAGGRMMTSGWG